MISAVRRHGNFDDQFKDLDLSGIRFPSDAVSIGDLRKKHAALFDKGFAQPQPAFFLEPSHGGHAEDMVGGMLYCERLVALFAFAEACGVEYRAKPGFDFKEELTEFYIRYEIASGTHHAAELIRDIEQQSVALANQKHP